MENFGNIEAFLAIVRKGSLTSAAKSLGVGVPAISHRLKALEEGIGVKLLTRTTRSIEVTKAGQLLFDGTLPAFDKISTAIENARTEGKSKSGVLKLTIPWSAYRIIVAPVLFDFQKAYPDIRLEMSFDEGIVDIQRAGFHAGFRLGDRLTENMIAAKLTPPLKAAYTASPSYLSQYGHPKHPRDLLDHKCIRYRFVSANRLAGWGFIENGQVITVDPPTHLIFDNFNAVVQAALDGHGIGWSLKAVVEDMLYDGCLESLLDQYTKEHPPFYIFYPEQNRQLEPLRIFIDFLKSRPVL